MVEGLGPVIGTSRPATIALLNHNVRSILHQKELKEAHPSWRRADNILYGLGGPAFFNALDPRH
jgi:hypothetical protein